ncbi:hypothetical protein TNCV_3144691 [Trichonephila clavipes]|nr:hypothetical protein TNCV_3144691 [Trichonephila clavipes]
MDKIECRSVIQYLFLKGNTPTQIKDQLDSRYGDFALSFTTVKFWQLKLNVASVGPPPAAINAATCSGIELLDTLCCLEADGPTNLEQPTLNHVQRDTMVSDPTRALQGTNRGAGMP